MDFLLRRDDSVPVRPTLGTDPESADGIFLEILIFETELHIKFESNNKSDSNIGLIPDIGAVDTWLPSFPK